MILLSPSQESENQEFLLKLELELPNQKKIINHHCFFSNPKVTYSKDEYCEWKTLNGSESMCRIQNIGTNTLTVVVIDAPEEIKTTDGKPFNGKYEIPPYITIVIMAIGDFKGKKVQINNVSYINDTDCVLMVNKGTLES